MRKVCPNLDREDGLDTVLEVPVPELHQEAPARSRRTVKAWMRSHMHIDHQQHRRDGAAPPRADVQIMLGVMGAPLVPQPVQPRRPMGGRGNKEEPLEQSKARYIVEQYVAAAGGEAALSAATSMFAMGKVRMSSSTTSKSKSKAAKKGAGEVHGGFVVWQKKPELWCVEMVVAGGTKMSAGSDGNVAWRQTPWQQAHASRGPPRPIRRCVQGLDPKSTADLFSSAASVGEESVDGEDCFLLRVDAEPSALHARSSADVEVIRHALWGYFSQRTGLLVRLEDSHLLRIPKPAESGGEGKAASASMYWETTMESIIGDYRPVDGINIAHAGRTVVSVSPFTTAAGAVEDADADADARRKRPCTCMEETWSIEEVEFNIAGLSTECFLPPRDLLLGTSNSKEQPRHKKGQGDKATKGGRDSDGGCGIRAAVAKKALVPVVTGLGWFGPAKVAAVDSLDAADESEDTTYAPAR
ncbi:hypothetical protein D1007_30467 [Hordeum vulgare]|uniref:Predicted protein n=1 Tax=Hordeum vulgare subsp. vulgare TaxID=112509 RepID=F2DHZ6_HORVV|nr:uncharacterized protein LOC123427977 [Hordeum vulgare subsp. vulgare]KAE8794746.1 hypothetical protein D1007_30467 [Hordeum vulgare]KAI5021486.1 hypothetical protein ZWY2020_058216 [Hordeum vulgare]BAJ94717.1 predicted protein [Hordeum vulgare subsp. vulgare]